MIKQLKHILVSMARLPSVDQRWILKHLSRTEVNTLHRWNGLKLLQDAQRFRSLSIPLEAPPKTLPAICQKLALKAPLYAAIVINQGSYSWAELFLQKFDLDGIIQTMLDNQLLDIKPIVKQAVFNEWQQSLSFETILDANHG